MTATPGEPGQPPLLDISPPLSASPSPPHFLLERVPWSASAETDLKLTCNRHSEIHSHHRRAVCICGATLQVIKEVRS